MTLPTGVQAIAENNYGRPDEALEYLQKMTRTFSYALPGSIYEVSPDYGMMTQAWNIYAFAIPIVQQFFGINPMAQNQMVSISPQMPSSWNNAALEHVKVGDNEISVFYKNDDGKNEITVLQTNPNWKIRLELPKEEYKVVTGEAEITEELDRLVFLSINTKLTVSKK